ncbi:MAG: putative maltokinase, partial [Candidatus Competibacterales bacterium]|nr:putative maltokinase [Candidatus Competibacterales bacterium]
AAAGSSNTGVILGNRLFLKGYRRLQPGLNLELEIGRFLTERSPFANTVPVAGAVEYEAGDGSVATLAMLQGFVVNQGDAWTWTQDYLRRFLDDVLTRPELQEEPAAELHSVYRLMSRTLGQRTGELHRALAVPAGDPAFEPEPVTESDLDQWLDAVEREAATTFDRLAHRLGQFPERPRELAERVLALRSRLDTRLAALRPESGFEAVKTRYHGDYHLGQVLIAEDDFIIIDFEGEPARPLAERRRKHSALRDVAGMLRSFDYAKHAALLVMTEEQPTALGQLQPLVEAWRDLIEDAFLSGYREGLGDCRVHPAEAEQGRRLIALFTLEKALYELRYEIDNRPDWIEVPLGGLHTILAEDDTIAP